MLGRMEPLMPLGVEHFDQYQSIRQNWGEDAARRYLAALSSPPPDPSPARPMGRWWVSNTQHQPRRFDREQVTQIRDLLSSGATYQTVANQFGCCRATIHNVAKAKGAYRNWAQSW